MMWMMTWRDWLTMAWEMFWAPSAQGWAKDCSCGLQYSLEGWKELKRNGIQLFDDGDRPESLEYRTCRRCQTTLAVEVVIVHV